MARVTMQTMRSGRWVTDGTLVVKREVPGRWITMMDGREVEWDKRTGHRVGSMDKGVRVIEGGRRGIALDVGVGGVMNAQEKARDRYASER